MRNLELLAPAKNIDIGIAAIDCGADAVYIAGPDFGARQAAGNSMEDIARLCAYAHKFSVRIFMTLNTIVFDDELDKARALIQEARTAGVDALIVQDLAVREMAHGLIPIHASTQCAIRDVDKALFYKGLGFSRLVLERELPLTKVREIAEATGCEIEFFVHGALCVCYSGNCYMSEYLTGRSANRGECIQACRSRYDLVDGNGRTLVRNKALLSLKDYNLLHRLEDLADAGVCSFKIEGRLKNISYVRNTVRAYSQAIDALVAKHPDKYGRASYGIVRKGFTPDLGKTFNRGYTELFLDGKRGQWASMDIPKGIGEHIGKVVSIRPLGRDNIELTLAPDMALAKDMAIAKDMALANGDGFTFSNSDGEVTGFRGDVCSGRTIFCKRVAGLAKGTQIYRNLSVAFEKTLNTAKCERLVPVNVDVTISDGPRDGKKNFSNDWDGVNGGKHYAIEVSATAQNGRTASVRLCEDFEPATNTDRAKSMFISQMSKAHGIHSFTLENANLHIRTSDGSIPFVSAAYVNNIRRTVSELLDSAPAGDTPTDPVPENGTKTGWISEAADYSCNIANGLARKVYESCGAVRTGQAYELTHEAGAELMRTKYCIRYELGICPKHHHCKPPEELRLRNNGREFALEFDCVHCEMVVKGI